MKIKRSVFLILFSLLPGFLCAEKIDMRDFIQLKRGMSEGEVLFRVGASNYESVYSNHHNEILKKVWYYIPTQNGFNAWITEITFDRRGTVSVLNRYRARK